MDVSPASLDATKERALGAGWCFVVRSLAMIVLRHAIASWQKCPSGYRICSPTCSRCPEAESSRRCAAAPGGSARLPGTDR